MLSVLFNKRNRKVLYQEQIHKTAFRQAWTQTHTLAYRQARNYKLYTQMESRKRNGQTSVTSDGLHTSLGRRSLWTRHRNTRTDTQTPGQSPAAVPMGTGLVHVPQLSDFPSPCGGSRGLAGTTDQPQSAVKDSVHGPTLRTTRPQGSEVSRLGMMQRLGLPPLSTGPALRAETPVTWPEESLAAARPSSTKQEEDSK